MDLDEARRLVAERLTGKESANVGVQATVVPAGWLSVHVHSKNPVIWFHCGVDLHPDGRVSLPPSDDGCTPVGTPGTLLATATDVASAVELVVTEAEELITGLEELHPTGQCARRPAGVRRAGGRRHRPRTG